MGLFDGFWNFITGGYFQNEQHNHNMELAKYQGQINQEYYERQLQDQIELFNQYQSPEAQVRLYQDAGINPALMFGKGPSSNPISTPTLTPPQLQSAQFPFSPVSGIIQELEQIANFTTNVKKNATELKKMEAEVSSIETSNQKMIAEIGQITKNTEKLDADIQKVWQDISLSQEQKNYVIAQIKQTESLTNKTDEEVLNIISQRELLEYEKRLKAQQELLTEYQSLNEKYKGRKTLQEIIQIANENALYSLRKQNLTLENIGLDYENALKLLQGDMSKEQLRGIVLDNQYKELEIKYKPQENQREWVNTGVNVFNAITKFITSLADSIIPL